MSDKFRRMFETRAHRPYYTMANLGGMGEPLYDITGFGYRKTVFIISSSMNNTAYFSVAEMNQATEHFRALWEDEGRVAAILSTTRERFADAASAERRGWELDWSALPLQELIQHLRTYFDLDLLSLGTMYVSNPQHVLPLEELITTLLDDRPERGSILATATTFAGEPPWAEEEAVIRSLREQWPVLSSSQRESALGELVSNYGWLNDIEGDRPFDREHYRRKILTSRPAPVEQPTGCRIPDEVVHVGRLIGELGYLRLWNRYHFMLLRYHMKKIVEELALRSRRPDLEYATVDEIEAFFRGDEVDFDEIGRRRSGYAAFLDQERAPHIVTGAEATRLAGTASEAEPSDSVVRGKIANRGVATGNVRTISFSAPDYDAQVAAFKHGEVLVTGMTRPQIVHLCAKASAIVTDEGGITCHAAVVSREFGIPCIIATHDATKLLTTGDRVLVDAAGGLEGTVTKLH